ncbi:MAG: DoxX family membrane protein [Dehalococcoidales bacterium]|nr:DoxX family membrane protein [Dehalococcoidales bacterium]
MAEIRHFLKSDKLTFAFRLLLGVMILAAVVPKLIDIEKYSVFLVYSYRVFPIYPINIARFLGIVAPYLELLIALGLIFGVLTRLSAIGWGIMSIVYFSIKIHLIFIQQRIVPCGCFPGIFPDILVTQSIWIDVVNILLCAQIIWANRERKFLSFWILLPEKWRRTKIRYVW